MATSHNEKMIRMLAHALVSDPNDFISVSDEALEKLKFTLDVVLQERDRERWEK